MVAASTITYPYNYCTMNPQCDEREEEQHHKATTTTMLSDYKNNNSDVSHRSMCETSETCLEGCAAYGLVCPCSARAAGRAAHAAVAKLRENSNIFSSSMDDEDDDDNGDECRMMNKLKAKDLVIGKKLGEGGFSVVNECTLKTDPEKKLAVKYLKRKVMVNEKLFEHGAADLAQEAHFLSVLDHPHIISLHGVTAGSVQANVSNGKERGFFITVDRLYDTLEKRLERWRREQERSNHSIFTRLVSKEYKNKREQEVRDRIKIAHAIADAMAYLHSKEIIYRDLKPDNIGFDSEGVLKLFDFGLAKELKPNEGLPDGRYELTGNTGSRRYMAPEVAKGLPYNKSVDSYSFGIMLHELLSAEKPFCGYSCGKHMSLVVMGGERPKMESRHTSYWPMKLQWLMKRCWSPFPTCRPDFTVIKQTLQDVLESKDSSLPDVTTTTTPPLAATTNQQSATAHTTSVVGKDNNNNVVPKNEPILPPIGGFSSLLLPIRAAKAKSHGSVSSNTSSSTSTSSPVKDQTGNAKGGMSLGWLRK